MFVEIFLRCLIKNTIEAFYLFLLPSRFLVLCLRFTELWYLMSLMTRKTLAAINILVMLLIYQGVAHSSFKRFRYKPVKLY